MKKLIILAAAILMAAGAVEAKWWIFGKANAEVGLKYLYINKVSADETGPKIKIFRETLGTGSLIAINGKAALGKGTVGSVRISLDDKANWTDVKFAENGTFEYSFKPEAGKTYELLVEVTDTAGKTNNVGETRKELSISNENIQAKVRETLDAMFDAYNREKLQQFMLYVGENFAGDKAMLERAVKRDFDALSNIVMRYTINNVAAGAQGRVFVSITYNRLVFINKTSASNTDSGATEFVFDSKEGKLALYSMKQPLMFGLSDAENVATGTVLGGGGAALVLDDGGNLGTGGILVTHSCSAGTMPGYTFVTAAKVCGGGDLFFYDGSFMTGMGFVVMNAQSFSEPLAGLNAADVRGPGYSSQTNFNGAGPGNTYCFEVGADYYCVEPVTMPTASNETVSFWLKKF